MGVRIRKLKDAKGFIRVSAICLIIVSAIFLIKGSLGLSAKDIAELSSTKYRYNLDVARNLARQQADTRVGFVVLLFSVAFEFVALWRMRPEINKVGVIISLVFSFLILFLGLCISDFLADKTLKEVEKIWG